jgi:hypothetical protein
MALIGNRYIQASSSDPGAVGFGYDWWQTDTGNVYTRNITNTGWTYVGSVLDTNLGNMPIGGCTVLGALVGAHGLMPTTAASPFTNTPNVNGEKVALLSDITDAISGVNDTISAAVQQAMASLPAPSINANVAIWSGTNFGNPGRAYNEAIAIPITGAYPDGTVPSQAECRFVSVSVSYASFPYGLTGAGDIRLFASTPGTAPLTWLCYTEYDHGGLTQMAAQINYSVLAIKGTA